MVEWLIKKTNLYKSMEDDIFNYEIEMATKQNKIRNLERDKKLLNERLAESERVANEIIFEKQNTINDLINKLDDKENARRKATGKVGSLNRKIKKLESDLQDAEERAKYWRGKNV